MAQQGGNPVRDDLFMERTPHRSFPFCFLAARALCGGEARFPTGPRPGLSCFLSRPAPPKNKKEGYFVRGVWPRFLQAVRHVSFSSSFASNSSGVTSNGVSNPSNAFTRQMWSVLLVLASTTVCSGRFTGAGSGWQFANEGPGDFCDFPRVVVDKEAGMTPILDQHMIEPRLG